MNSYDQYPSPNIAGWCVVFPSLGSVHPSVLKMSSWCLVAKTAVFNIICLYTLPDKNVPTVAYTYSLSIYTVHVHISEGNAVTRPADSLNLKSFLMLKQANQSNILEIRLHQQGL